MKNSVFGMRDAGCGMRDWKSHLWSLFYVRIVPSALLSMTCYLQSKFQFNV